MRSELAHCAGCGHKVRLVFTDPPPHDGQANLREDAEIVCLDYKEGCTAGVCPNTGRPGIVMGVRLAKSHMNDGAFKTLHARCEGCGQVTDLEVLDGTFALCPLCNTTNRWVRLELDDSTITITGR
ncbi:MAG TPA: hypothetical protein VLH75_17795 [Longimicrobiales bacterium]|nr:hypothetical protein [Longimicrobiales bacterium]